MLFSPVATNTAPVLLEETWTGLLLLGVVELIWFCPLSVAESLPPLLPQAAKVNADKAVKLNFNIVFFIIYLLGC